MTPELKVWQINVISNILQKMVHLYAFYVHQDGVPIFRSRKKVEKAFNFKRLNIFDINGYIYSFPLKMLNTHRL